VAEDALNSGECRHGCSWTFLGPFSRATRHGLYKKAPTASMTRSVFEHATF
jgi:hypothetical protein